MITTFQSRQENNGENRRSRAVAAERWPTWSYVLPAGPQSPHSAGHGASRLSREDIPLHIRPHRPDIATPLQQPLSDQLWQPAVHHTGSPQVKYLLNILVIATQPSDLTMGNQVDQQLPVLSPWLSTSTWRSTRPSWSGGWRSWGRLVSSTVTRSSTQREYTPVTTGEQSQFLQPVWASVSVWCGTSNTNSSTVRCIKLPAAHGPQTSSGCPSSMKISRNGKDFPSYTAPARAPPGNCSLPRRVKPSRWNFSRRWRSLWSSDILLTE